MNNIATNIHKTTINDQTRANNIIDRHLSNRMTIYACGLFVTVAVLLLFGLTMLYSASYHTHGTYYFFTQLMWLSISLFAGIAVFLVGFRALANWSSFLLFFLVVLLTLAVTCYEPTNGAYRWLKIDIGGFKASIQPSEFVKVVLPLYVGKYCADHFRNISSMFGRYGAWWAIAITSIMCFMILLGRDLGTTVLVFTVSFVILFVAGLRVRYYLIPAGLLVFMFYAVYLFNPERWARVTSFLDPKGVQAEEGYQLWLSLLALGSGSWNGVGLLESRLKADYLQENHTDFIIAVIGEELGYIALLGVLIGYILFFYFAIKISTNASSRQGVFIGVGLTSTITIQALINMAVVSGSLPTKGIPAPFLSYGGSSILMTVMSLAILLNIAVDTAAPEFNNRVHQWCKKRLKIG